VAAADETELSMLLMLLLSIRCKDSCTEEHPPSSSAPLAFDFRLMRKCIEQAVMVAMVLMMMRLGYVWFAQYPSLFVANCSLLCCLCATLWFTYFMRRRCSIV